MYGVAGEALWRGAGAEVCFTREIVIREYGRCATDNRGGDHGDHSDHENKTCEQSILEVVLVIYALL